MFCLPVKKKKEFICEGIATLIVSGCLHRITLRTSLGWEPCVLRFSLAPLPTWLPIAPPPTTHTHTRTHRKAETLTNRPYSLTSDWVSVVEFRLKNFLGFPYRLQNLGKQHAPRTRCSSSSTTSNAYQLEMLNFEFSARQWLRPHFPAKNKKTTTHEQIQTPARLEYTQGAIIQETLYAQRRFLAPRTSGSPHTDPFNWFLPPLHFFLS